MPSIFDANDYPFHEDEGNNFYDALCKFFTKVNDAVAVYEKCGLPATDLFTQQSPSDLWRSILRELAAKDKLRSLCAYLESITIPDYLKNSIEAGKRGSTSAHQLPVYDYGQLILTKETVVLDRKPLLEKLPGLFDGQHYKPVLLIRGNDKSGKSHTKNIFEHYTDQQNITSIYISRKTTFTIKNVLDKLFTRVEATAPTVPATTDPAWYQEVCEKLRQKVEERRKVFWLLIDDMHKVDTPVKDFFDQFVALMEDKTFRKYFRLVLISYPKGTQTCWTLKHLGEVELRACDIKPQHVKEAIAARCKLKGLQMLEEDMNKDAEDIFKQACLPNAPRCKMKDQQTDTEANMDANGALRPPCPEDMVCCDLDVLHDRLMDYLNGI